MDLNLLSTTALKYFAEVVRTGSIRSASESLFVAASAISRQLGMLEESLGAPLIERRQGRGKIKITAAGELLMRYFKNISNESRRLHSEIEALQGLRRGHVKFGIPESFTRHFMPGFLTNFSRRFPGFSYNVQLAQSPRLIEILLLDELDACFTFGNFTLQDVLVVYSRLVSIHVVVPDGHPLEKRDSLRLADCAEFGLALPDATMWAKQHYDEMLAKAKIRPRVVLETNSYELMRNVAVAGMCLTFAALPFDDHSASRQGCSYVPLKDPRVRPQRLSLCIHAGRNLPLPVTTFLSELIATLEAIHSRADRSGRS